MTNTLTRMVPIISFDEVRPHAVFSTEESLPAPKYEIIHFNGSKPEDTVSFTQFKSAQHVEEYMLLKIADLVEDFSVLNLHFPRCEKHDAPLNRAKIYKACADAHVVWNFNSYTDMWRFVPAHPSVYEQVYQRQAILQFMFHPKANGEKVWNLDANDVAKMATKGHCTLLGKPQEGVWVIEPWKKSEGSI